MADQDPATAHPTPPAMEVPTLRAPDIQLIFQDLAQSRRDLFEERKNSANRIAEERDRSRWEGERLRAEFGVQLKSIEHENEALMRAVGRLQGENDRLREENAMLRLTKLNGHVEEKPATAPAPDKVQDVSALSRGTPKRLEVALVMPSNPMGAKPVAMPPAQGLPPGTLPVMPPPAGTVQSAQLPPRTV